MAAPHAGRAGDVLVSLIFLVVRIVTMPLTWLAYLAGGALSAARGVEQHNLCAIAA